MKKALVPVGKLMSLILRHDPDKFGLELDGQGWLDVDALIAAVNRSGSTLDRALIEEVVFTNDKQRFAFSDDGRWIRANQGHSVDIDLGLDPVPPPPTLFHGTATRFVDSIREQGLMSGQRRHVHLSATRDTAHQVGQRHGKPLVLVIDAAAMSAEGMPFFLSENGVWLTGHVPPAFIRSTLEV